MKPRLVAVSPPQQQVNGSSRVCSVSSKDLLILMPTHPDTALIMTLYCECVHPQITAMEKQTFVKLGETRQCGAFKPGQIRFLTNATTRKLQFSESGSLSICQTRLQSQSLSDSQHCPRKQNSKAPYVNPVVLKVGGSPLWGHQAIAEGEIKSNMFLYLCHSGEKNTSFQCCYYYC